MSDRVGNLERSSSRYTDRIENTTIGRAHVAVADGVGVGEGLRKREMRWLQDHGGELRSGYSGRWVAIEGDGVVAVGASEEEADQIARAKGIEAPFILKVPAEGELWVMGMSQRAAVAMYDHVVPYDASQPVPRPMLPIRIVYEQEARDRLALLDSGADLCCFPSTLAAILGIDLSRLPSGATLGVSGVARSWRGSVHLVIGPREFADCPVLFVDNPDCPYLIGRAPIFRELQIGFREARREVYLAFDP